jgi:hypothetical protein
VIRRQATALAVAIVLAVLLGAGALVEGLWWPAVLVIAAVPLVLLGLPAGLMLAATLRYGDPYDLLDRPGSVTPPE